VGDTSEVGSYPLGTSPYGVLDMAGNVWEWVNDWYQGDYYDDAPYYKPTGPTSGTLRVMRGGMWYKSWNYLRVAYRYYFYYPANQPANVGFRCASPSGN
jgi:formylglycine-generating enzyme required for sulfatase activity